MSHNVFLSWSGEQAKQAADAFRTFLVDVINAAKPFISSSDIDKGARWDGEIRGALKECLCGVVFVNRDNRNSPWLLYEAGALSNAFEKSRCCTFLMNVRPGEVEQPLGGLQHTMPVQSDVLRLLHTINSAITADRRDVDLARACEKFWPDFNAALTAIKASSSPASDAELRTDRSVLEEILGHVRRANISPAAWVSARESKELRFAQAGFPANTAYGELMRSFEVLWLEERVLTEVYDEMKRMAHEYGLTDARLAQAMGKIINYLSTRVGASSRLGEYLQMVKQKFETELRRSLDD